MLAREMEVKEVNRKVERGRQLGRSSRVDESTQQEMYQPSHLTQQSAHDRSHQRSHSAQQHMRDNAGVKDGVARHLKTQFEAFSKLGDRRSDGSHVTCSQSDKWLKQVGAEWLAVSPGMVFRQGLLMGGY